MSDVDLKNATQLFNTVWATLEEEYTREKLVFPKEIMWLGGAPGSGKGTNTPFIMRERGFTANPIIMSSLLNSPEMEALKDDGRLVGDREVVEILLRELLKPIYETGVVVDGFPRTKVQVECVRMFYRKMMELRQEFFDTPIGPRFRRPIFRITILFVSEEISIARQISRGKKIAEHNEAVNAGAEGDIIELRSTDLDPNKAAERYYTFRDQTLNALQSLKKIFHYHFIDANGPIEGVEAKINSEFVYQSSLELGHDTNDSISAIPVADQITQHARQELVRRLDNYRHRHNELFARVIALMTEQILPVINQQAAVGRARVRIENPILDQPMASNMMTDILTERGFFTTAELIEQHVPLRVDPETHAIISAVRKTWLINIEFPSPAIRRGGH